MIVDLKEVIPFIPWLFGSEGQEGALLTWLVTVVALTLAVTLIGWLVAAVRYGPSRATAATGHLIRGAVADLIQASPRRILALTWLSIKESIRRRVVVVFAVFILLLSFAGWFLDPGSDYPARLYLSFVMTATSYLVLLLALFLSALSLPADIKSKTLHTVVTKPVRASEIVLGRILGFSAVGTCLLVVMGFFCYIFVQRGLSHAHTLTADNLQTVEGVVAGESGGQRGRTSRENNHRHKVIIDPSGRQGRVEMEQGHWHALTISGGGDKVTYSVGPAEDVFLARVPVYGKLAFRNRTGQPAEKGINVGDEWTYRSYIEGGTLGAAVWTFSGIAEDRFPKGLPVEMTLGAFRTSKGQIEKGLPGSLAVRNPKTGEKVDVRIFESKEYVTDVQFIPRDLQTADGQKRDLFRDLVDDGRIEIWLTSVAPAQYLGAAQADLYLRAGDASFFLNFAKGYFGIWLQMMLLAGMGVLFSTFLSGPVAMIATLGCMVGGFFNAFMFKLAMGEIYGSGPFQALGGGPFESFIRMLTQQAITSEMEPGLQTTVAQTLDQVMQFWLRVVATVLPDLSRFSFAKYVAFGFNISGDTVLVSACRTLAFLVPVFVAAYVCLKTREVGK